MRWGLGCALGLWWAATSFANGVSDYRRARAWIALHATPATEHAVAQAATALPPFAQHPRQSEYARQPDRRIADARALTEDDAVIAPLARSAQQAVNHPVPPPPAAGQNLRVIAAHASAIASGTDPACGQDTGNHPAWQCGGKIVCAGGHCQRIQSVPNADFGRVATRLKAVSAAGRDVAEQGNRSRAIQIFAGSAMHCRDIVLGALNCCRDTGWAKGILLHCSDEERRIGVAKEQGDRVVYTGRYCSKRIFGFCVEHRKGYCVFPSKIAYDVQVGGRFAQLHRGFGDGESPDCRGLTVGEMTRLNLDAIDFRNITGDVARARTFPTASAVRTRIAKTLTHRAAFDAVG